MAIVPLVLVESKWRNQRDNRDVVCIGLGDKVWLERVALNAGTSECLCINLTTFKPQKITHGSLILRVNEQIAY